MEAMDQLLELFDLAPELNFGTNQGWAPGKLFLAGEYAVLAPDQPALLFAVGQYLHCRVGISPWPGRGLLQSNLPDLEDWHYERANLYEADSSQWRYVLAAMQLVEELVKELGRPLQDYRLSIDSQLLADNGRKYGFGSSGAVTVAVIQALLAFYGLVAKTPLMHYKLAAMAMMRLGSKGSLADLAVNAYGGWLYYVAPDRLWLQKALANHSILSLLSQDWPSLVIKPMSAPADLEVLVGWTGVPASTDSLIDQWQGRARGAHQAHRAAVEHGFHVGAGYPVDGVFQHSGHAVVVFGRGQQQHQCRKPQPQRRRTLCANHRKQLLGQRRTQRQCDHRGQQRQHRLQGKALRPAPVLLLILHVFSLFRRFHGTQNHRTMRPVRA